MPISNKYMAVGASSASPWFQHWREKTCQRPAPTHPQGSSPRIPVSMVGHTGYWLAEVGCRCSSSRDWAGLVHHRARASATSGRSACHGVIRSQVIGGCLRWNKTKFATGFACIFEGAKPAAVSKWMRSYRSQTVCCFVCLQKKN